MRVHNEFIRLKIVNWRELSMDEKIEALKIAAQLEQLLAQSKNPTSAKVGSVDAKKIIEFKSMLSQRTDSGN